MPKLPYQKPAALSLVLGLSLASLACDRIPEEPAGEGATGAQKTAGVAADASPQSATGMTKTVPPAEFAQLHQEKGGILLDVRTAGEVARGRIAGASTVDYTDRHFANRVARMQKDVPIFVYCATGARSRAAARDMKKLGFQEIYDLSGGIFGWKRAGLPIEAGAVQRAEGANVMSPAQFDELLAKDKLVLADFHTPWCHPCVEMAPIVDGIAAGWKGRATVVRVDVDESEALATREKAEGLPVFVLYKKGKEIWRHSGKLARTKLEEQLESALQ